MSDPIASAPSAAGYGDPQPDFFGEPYQALTLPLADDREGPVVSTLVRRRGDRPTTSAVLYLHGFSDYFHQKELADFHIARGDDFYAVDLRKNGRSLLPHQTPANMTDVSDYYPELDAALATIIAVVVRRTRLARVRAEEPPSGSS